MALRRSILALAASAALASCNMVGHTAPQEPWAQFAQGAIDGWLKLDPGFAVYQGAHQYDGKWADWSAAGLKARGDFLRKVIDDAAGYTAVTGKEKFERDYMIQVAKGQLFWLDVADQPHTNPAWYVGAFDPNVYLARVGRSAYSRAR